jgi:hypothetical protein
LNVVKISIASFDLVQMQGDAVIAAFGLFGLF